MSVTDNRSSDEKRLESLLRRDGKTRLSAVSIMDALTKMYGLGNSTEYHPLGEIGEREENEEYTIP